MPLGHYNFIRAYLLYGAHRPAPYGHRTSSLYIFFRVIKIFYILSFHVHDVCDRRAHAAFATYSSMRQFHRRSAPFVTLPSWWASLPTAFVPTSNAGVQCGPSAAPVASGRSKDRRRAPLRATGRVAKDRVGHGHEYDAFDDTSSDDDDVNDSASASASESER
jgi:hypothetical protein